MAKKNGWLQMVLDAVAWFFLGGLTLAFGGASLTMIYRLTQGLADQPGRLVRLAIAGGIFTVLLRVVLRRWGK